MLCTECKKEQESRIPNEEKELIIVFILFWLIMLPNLPQDNSVLANNCANICQTAKEYIGI